MYICISTRLVNKLWREKFVSVEIRFNEPTGCFHALTRKKNDKLKILLYCAQVTPPTKDKLKYFGMVSEINRFKRVFVYYLTIFITFCCQFEFIHPKEHCLKIIFVQRMEFTYFIFSRTPSLHLRLYTEPAQVYSLTTLCIVFTMLQALK